MHKTLQRLIILSMLVIMTLSLTPSKLTYAQDEPVIKATVISTALVVRAGPGVNFTDLALLEEDAEFTVLAAKLYLIMVYGFMARQRTLYAVGYSLIFWRSLLIFLYPMPPWLIIGLCLQVL